MKHTPLSGENFIMYDDDDQDFFEYMAEQPRFSAEETGSGLKSPVYGTPPVDEITVYKDDEPWRVVYVFCDSDDEDYNYAIYDEIFAETGADLYFDWIV